MMLLLVNEQTCSAAAIVNSFTRMGTPKYLSGTGGTIAASDSRSGR